MLRQTKDERTLKQTLVLASSTAFSAGIINVGGLVAFFAFTSSISGHLTNNIVKRNFGEIMVFIIWMLMFFAGAFISSFTVKSFGHKNPYRAHSIPIIMEMVVLLFVAIYGYHFYTETQVEREIVIGCTIFAMGLQTGLVSIVSGGLIKSTSLASLFTDLGGEVAEYYHFGTLKDKEIKDRIFVRLTVLGFYILGGLAGGFFFTQYEFGVFFCVPVILILVLL